LKKKDRLEAIGFEVDVVKKVKSGDCMVRLTAYYRISGNVRILHFVVLLLAPVALPDLEI